MDSIPAITGGTDKQIAYATEIRAAYMRGFVERVPADKRDAALADVGGKLTTDAVRWIEMHKALVQRTGVTLGAAGQTTIPFGPAVRAAISDLAK